MALKVLFNEYYKQAKYSESESERRHFRNLKLRISELEEKTNLQDEIDDLEELLTTIKSNKYGCVNAYNKFLKHLKDRGLNVRSTLPKNYETVTRRLELIKFLQKPKTRQKILDEFLINRRTLDEDFATLEKGIDLVKEAKYRYDNVDMIPENEEEERIDCEFGKIAADIAISRHTGKMESVYTPMGMMYYQIGKDLTEAKYVIGTGGVIINNSNPKEILQKMCSDSKKPLELRPRNPIFLLDEKYILSAMGLLSMHEPEVALKIMKKNMRSI